MLLKFDFKADKIAFDHVRQSVFFRTKNTSRQHEQKSKNIKLEGMCNKQVSVSLVASLPLLHNIRICRTGGRVDFSSVFRYELERRCEETVSLFIPSVCVGTW